MEGTSNRREGKIGRSRPGTATMTMSVGNVESSNVSGESGKSIAHQSDAEFAATLKEIDEAINENSEIQNLNKEGSAVTVEQQGKETDMEVSIMTEVTDINNAGVQLTHRSTQVGEHVVFTASWVENDRDKKGRKGGACGTKSKIQSREKGPSRAIQANGPRPNGTWIRMHDKLRNLSEPIVAEKDGPKHKKTAHNEEEDVKHEKEKRTRMDEEAKNLCMLMATKFKSAEVAKQLRREQ